MSDLEPDHRLKLIDAARIIMDEFARELRALRIERSVSLRDLGLELGMSYVVIHRIEHGTWIPDRTQVAVLLTWMDRGDTPATGTEVPTVVESGEDTEESDGHQEVPRPA